MNSNLIKRIFSSIVLLIILLIILNISNIFFTIFLLCIYVISCYEWKNLSSNNFTKFVGWAFLSLSLISIYKIKNFENNDLIYFFLLISVGSDLGGFLFGKILGGPKLTSISPKKTYSGSIGGFILSFFFFWLYLVILDLSFFGLIFSDIKFIILVLFLSLISQLGDLVISYFKRKSKVKDTGKIIPGHGGLLDRIDGIIFVSPLFYLIVFIINF